MSTTIFNKDEADFDPDSMLGDQKNTETVIADTQSNSEIEAALLEADRVLSLLPPIPVPQNNQDTVEMKTIPMDFYYKGKFKTRVHIGLLECDISFYSVDYEFFIDRSGFNKIYSLFLKNDGENNFTFKNPIIKNDRYSYLVKSINMKNTEKNTVIMTIRADKR